MIPCWSPGGEDIVSWVVDNFYCRAFFLFTCIPDFKCRLMTWNVTIHLRGCRIIPWHLNIKNVNTIQYLCQYPYSHTHGTIKNTYFIALLQVYFIYFCWKCIEIHVVKTIARPSLNKMLFRIWIQYSNNDLIRSRNICSIGYHQSECIVSIITC